MHLLKKKKKKTTEQETYPNFRFNSLGIKTNKSKIKDMTNGNWEKNPTLEISNQNRAKCN